MLGDDRTTRIAVLGLYRSGSTAVAGVLHRLGVNMGERFFADYYEPQWLSEQLRGWWNEPQLIEQVGKRQRVRVLRQWVLDREKSGSRWVGAKHPLLCLCGEDLVEAWGEETKFIRTYRPLEESIKSLARLDWWPDVPSRLLEFQQRSQISGQRSVGTEQSLVPLANFLSLATTIKMIFQKKLQI